MIFSNLKTMLSVCSALLLFSCSSDESSEENRWGIPKDEVAGENPIIDESNVIIPNALFSTVDNTNKIRINLTGIFDSEAKEWLKLAGTQAANQNIWVEIDNAPKSIVVINKSDDISQKTLVDLVFSIDNSGSMSEEADALASTVIDWATKLSAQNIDIRFSCVGYGYYHNRDNPNGGINFTNLQGIHDFFNRPNKSGRARTLDFEGPDATELIAASENYKKAIDECGAEAIRFADENYKFRSGANRIYVNFTDEPNQPNGHEGISVEYFANQANWNTSQGTIHTVYSANENYTHTARNEHPWKMSEYTGGTVQYANTSFTNVSLETLPITGAMTNSYVIEFINNSQITDGAHNVRITIRSLDGSVQAERIFGNVSFTN